MSIFITDGDARSTLSIVRSLGKRGLDVIVGSEREKSLTFYSKYCSKKIIYPPPSTEKSKFVEFMLSFVKENSIDFLVPTSDLTIYPISEKLDEFNHYTKVACPEKGIFDKAYDKAETLKIAKKLNIHIPKTYFVNKLDELEDLSEQLQYPIVIKPRISRYWKDDQMIHGFRKFVHSKSEFVDTYFNLHSQIPFPLVQEFIDGEGYGIFVLTRQGEPLAIFAHKRLREVPLSGGVSTLREAIEPNPLMKEWTIKLLKNIKWDYVAMVEFKLDKKDNTPKLMEINGRFWGSLELAVSSGVDFPYLLYQANFCDTVDPVFNFNIGHKCRWLKGDIEHLKLVFESPNFGRTYKMRVLLDFLKLYERNMSYDSLKREDPRPGIHENISYLKYLFFYFARRIIK
jgi:predicted ATP-grasp superfamily ATP-dependent carboligase